MAMAEKEPEYKNSTITMLYILTLFGRQLTNLKAFIDLGYIKKLHRKFILQFLPSL